MTGRIRITGIEVLAHHGVYESEQREGQLFKVDLDIGMDLEPAASSDALSDTLDYGVLAQSVHDLVAGERHDLIETVADRVAAMVLEDQRVDDVAVTVHKPQAPIEVAFGDVSVTVQKGK